MKNFLNKIINFFNTNLGSNIPNIPIKTFLGLQDTPSSYTGNGGKFVAVKSDVTGLEFIALTGGGHTIQEEGTDLTQRTNLNFKGATVTATDDEANDATVITISNPPGSGDVLGPATNTADYIPQWDGANSKTLKNGLAVPAGGLAGLTALGTKLDSSAFSDAGVTGKLITGFTSGAGAVAGTDTILQAINKLDGNIGTKGAGTVTSVAAITLGTTGTDLSSTVANGTTTPVITLQVPTASATNRGALSAADWSTFNGKQDALTFGIADTNKVQINSADVADNDFAKFTATGLEGRSYTEVKQDLDLEIGTDVQAYDAGLTDIAGLAVTDGNIIVGNGANWVAESGATARTSLGLGTMATETATDYVAKSLFDAQTILHATTDNTPVALTVTEQTVVGRKTGGNIEALAIDSDLSSVSANDDTIPSAKATKAMGDLKLALAGGTMTGALVLNGHGTASTAEAVNQIYGTSATPPAGTYPEGTDYIQYTA